MKINTTLHIQAEKYPFESEYRISINSFKNKSYGDNIVIDITTHDIELDIPDLEQNKLKLSHVEQLKERKVKLMADNEMKLQAIDDEIQTLLSIENKQV